MQPFGDWCLADDSLAIPSALSECVCVVTKQNEVKNWGPWGPKALGSLAKMYQVHLRLAEQLVRA